MVYNKMKRMIRKPAVLLLLVLLGASLALAQDYRPFQTEVNDIQENRSRLKFGPFRFWPRFQLREVGYDGNVYRERAEDDPVRDFTASLAPEFQLNILFSDWIILRLRENPEYVYYYKELRERAWNNTLIPEMKLLFFQRIVFSGSYELSSRRRRGTSEFDVRADEKQKVWRAGLFYETPRGTLFGLSGVKSTVSYEDIFLPGEDIHLARRLNRREVTGNLEIYYPLFSVTDFFLKAGITEYTFDSLESSWRNARSYQVEAGLRFPLLGRIRGLLSLGYKELIPEAEDKSGFSGLYGNTSLEYRAGRFNYRLSYSRDNRFSFWTNNIYFVEQRYGAGISFYLTRFLRLDYNFIYGRSSYPEPELLLQPDGSFAEENRRDLYLIHTIGFVVRLVGNTGVGLNYNIWERDSNYYRARRSRTFIGGYVTYSF
jgi:hypothetical protein